MRLWRVKRIESRQVQMDFTSSGQGRPTVTQLLADSEVIANAMEYTSWAERVTQVEVCTQCGTEGCQTGGWVAVRRVGEMLVWVPAFDEMIETDLGPDEFVPPRYFGSRGIPCFDGAVLHDAAGPDARFPPPTALPLSRRELGLTIQWSAPERVLGALPATPRIRRDAVIACSEPDVTAALDALDRELSVAVEDRGPAILPSRIQAARTLDLTLDVPGYPTWSPAVVTDAGLALILDAG